MPYTVRLTQDEISGKIFNSRFIMQSATAIHEHIKRAKKIVIVPHQNPDGDAIGSATAFYHYVTSLGKHAVVFCATQPNSKLQFISKGVPIYSDPVTLNEEIDMVVVLDSGDLRYAGIADLLQNLNPTIINIDHHATNENYGHLNLVIPTAASTTEILFKYFRHNGIRITQKMATSLLTGLSTDTGNFTNAATSSSALKASGELILSGGNFNLVTNHTLKNKSVESLRLWGKALSRLQRDEKINLTYTYITRDDLKEFGVGEGETEGISNYLSNLENSHITLLLSETSDGKVKGSFRTTRDDIDVSAIAKKLNGGGHKKAAGFTAEGTIEEVLKKVLTQHT